MIPLSTDNALGIIHIVFSMVLSKSKMIISPLKIVKSFVPFINIVSQVLKIQTSAFVVKTPRNNFFRILNVTKSVPETIQKFVVGNGR